MSDPHSRLGNNAQITGKILLQLASTHHLPEQQALTDDLLRAMILVRLTGELGYLTASHVEWRSVFDDHDHDHDHDNNDDEDGDEETGNADAVSASPAARQGAALVNTQEFISEMVAHILDDDVVKARAQALFPDIDDDAYSALQTFVWIALTNIEYFGSYDGITAPTFDEIDADFFVRSYLRWYHTWLDEQSDH